MGGDVAPVDRDRRYERPQKRRGTRGALGVHVARSRAAGPSRRPAAGPRPPCRQLASSRRTGRCRPRSTRTGSPLAREAERLGGLARPAGGAARGEARGRRATSTPPTSVDSPSASSIRLDAGAAQEARRRRAAPARGAPPAEHPERGQVEVVAVEMGDQDGVDPLRRLRGVAVHAAADAPYGRATTGSVRTRAAVLDEHRGVAEVGDSAAGYVSRRCSRPPGGGRVTPAG